METRKVILAVVGIIIIIIAAVMAWYYLQPAPTEKKKKVVWATIAGFYTDWAEAITANFTRETGIEVEVVGIDFAVMYEKESLELAGATGAFDVVTIETIWLAEWASAGYLEPLDEYIANTPAEEIQFEDILPHYRWLLSWGGHIYGLPYYTYDQGIIYRADLFRNETIQRWYEEWINQTYPEYAGEKLEEPSHEMTWDQYLRIAEFFDEVVPDDIMPYGVGMMAGRFPHIQDEWMGIMWGLGGDHFDANYNIIVNQTEGVRAAELYCKFLKHAPPGALQSAYDEVVAQMQQGLIPMTMTFYLDQWPNMVITEELIPGAKMACSTPVGGRGYIGCFALGIASASQNKDEAWEFIKWLAGPEGQYSFAKGGGTTCRKSVLLNPDFDPSVNPEMYKYTEHFKYIYEIGQLLQQLPDWQKPPRVFRLPVGGKLYDAMMNYMSDIASGLVDPKTGMDQLASMYSQILGWYPSMSPPPGWTPPS